MLDEKIKLNNAIRNFISDIRKSSKQIHPELSADYISEKIGRSKSWLSQVENGRLKTVKTKDLVNAFTIINSTTYERAEEYVDDQISSINAQIKNSLITEDGDLIDFSEHVIFLQLRGHLWYAIKNFNRYSQKLKSSSTEEIKDNLKKYVKYWLSNIVYWIDRAVPNISKLFSDEVSLTNLYLIVELSYQILNENYEYYGLNKPNISKEELQSLKIKLNDNEILIPKTVVKPINEYSYMEIDKVIQYYNTENYLEWENHGDYLGNDPFPLLVNYKYSLSDKDSYKLYDDITTQAGLSEKEYLHIIKQLCFLLDRVYKNGKHYIEEYYDECEASNDLLQQIQQLEEENKTLKKQIEELKNNNSLPE